MRSDTWQISRSIFAPNRGYSLLFYSRMRSHTIACALLFGHGGNTVGFNPIPKPRSAHRPREKANLQKESPNHLLSYRWMQGVSLARFFKFMASTLWMEGSSLNFFLQSVAAGKTSPSHRNVYIWRGIPPTTPHQMLPTAGITGNCGPSSRLIWRGAQRRVPKCQCVATGCETYGAEYGMGGKHVRECKPRSNLRTPKIKWLKMRSAQ